MRQSLGLCRTSGRRRCRRAWWLHGSRHVSWEGLIGLVEVQAVVVAQCIHGPYLATTLSMASAGTL